MDESIESFFKSNEEKVNTILSKVSIILTLIYPLLIILKISGIYAVLSVKSIILYWIISLLFVISFYIINKKKPESRVNKYFFIISIELLIFALSVSEGILIYVSYVAIILLSCLYFDQFFTFQIELIAFISMMVSLSLRSSNLPDILVETSKEDWGIIHSTGSAIEFILYGIFCFYLSLSIRKLLISIYEHKRGLQNVQDQLTFGFANIIEAKDECTGEHIKRTSEYVWLLCLRLRQNNIYPEFVNEHTSELMVNAAPFHDLGKICIPDYILNKQGKLTKEEFDIIQHHPRDGAEFIHKKMKTIGDPELIEMARDMALCHHEHMDGTGYPNRLIGDEIPVCARIMTIADILDALLSVRSYKKAYSISEALDIIKKMAGNELDSKIVDVLLECDEEIKVIRDGGISSDEEF